MNCKLPDQPFHNFRGWKSLNRRILCCPERQSTAKKLLNDRPGQLGRRALPKCVLIPLLLPPSYLDRRVKFLINCMLRQDITKSKKKDGRKNYSALKRRAKCVRIVDIVKAFFRLPTNSNMDCCLNQSVHMKHTRTYFNWQSATQPFLFFFHLTMYLNLEGSII